MILLVDMVFSRGGELACVDLSNDVSRALQLAIVPVDAETELVADKMHLFYCCCFCCAFFLGLRDDRSLLLTLFFFNFFLGFALLVRCLALHCIAFL